jgi:hypothetical protein
VLLFGAPTALADTTPTGTSTGQVTATTDTAQAAPSSTPNPATAGPADTTTGTPSSQVVGAPDDTSPPNSTGPPSTTSATPSTTPSTPTSTPLDDLLASVKTSESDPANPTSSTDTADSAPSITPTDAPGSSSQTAQAGATASQTSPANGNLSVRVGDGGTTGPVGQGNQATSSAGSIVTGNEASAGAGPTASSTATTTQDSPTNANIQVRVGSPGDIAPITQQNDAQAGAGAAGTPGSSGSAPGGASSATATQTSPGNLNVIVRVGSPGDNGTVTQQNTVGASAVDPSVSNSGTAGGTWTPGTDQLASSTNSAGVSNTGQVQQVIEQTNNGSADDAPSLGSSATPADPLGFGDTAGYARASQTDPSNTNVSIRVGSAGSDGLVTQTNSATATGTSDDLTFVEITGGKNVNVSVVIPGSAGGAPGDQWAWNWSWTGDGTPAAGASAASVAPTTGSVWTWAWLSAAASAATAPATGSSTSTSAAPAGTPGSWTWTWTWIMADGQKWTLSQQQACDCNWFWNWTWDWSSATPVQDATAQDTTAPTGADDAPSPAPDETSDTAAVDQLNTVSASAWATADVTLNQYREQTQSTDASAPADQTIWADQRILSTQSALADAQAIQIRPWNLNAAWGVSTESVTQTNKTSANADAQISASAYQEILQEQDGAGDVVQWVAAQQWAENDQTATAAAQANQTDVGNSNIAVATARNQALIGAVEQENSAQADATAWASALLGQWISQLQTAGDAAVQMTDALQVIQNIQGAVANAAVIQMRTENLSTATVQAGSLDSSPRLRQRNEISSSAVNDAFSAIGSLVIQVEGGDAPIQVSSSIQEASIISTGTAFAGVLQNDNRNVVNWVGLTPPPPAPDGGDSGGGEQTVPVAPTSSAFTINGPNMHLASTRSQLLPGKPGTLKAGATPVQGVAGAQHFSTVHLAAGNISSSAASINAMPASGQTNVGATTFAQTSVSGPMTNASPSGSASLPLTSGRTGSAGLAARGGAPEGPQTPWIPGMPGDPGSAGTGTSGSAPAPGSGLTALAIGPTKLAAPALIGPQMPASVLGRPVIFLDPFERPG